MRVVLRALALRLPLDQTVKRLGIEAVLPQKSRALIGKEYVSFECFSKPIPPERMLPPGASVGQPAGHSFSERPDSARDHLSHPAGTGGSAPAGDCDAGGSKPPDGKSDCVDHRELCQNSARGRTRTACEHGRVHAAPSLPGADRDESASVSKATPAPVSAEPDAEQWSRCRECGF